MFNPEAGGLKFEVQISLGHRFGVELVKYERFRFQIFNSLSRWDHTGELARDLTHRQKVPF